MGRSCFNIISCGCINQSKDIDDINISSQNKGPDKPGWSSRKKSPRHEAPSNTVVNDNISSTDNKEIPEPITTSSEPNINSNVSEETSDDILTKEIPNSATEPVCIEDDTKHERAPEKSESESEYEYESATLVIQAAIRRFLAERQLVKHKNVVKLQAAVRGHLVRNHAVGTLRCVQAIVKMQALVRARREKVVRNAGIINSNPTHVSIEKLLSNRLARQLLESTPKTKQINIKCNPSKSDSAWNWLERWMSVSSTETLQPHTQDHDQDKVVNNTEDEVKTVISKPIPENLVLNTESNLIPENPVLETEPEPIPENPVSETEPEPEPKHEPISENPVLETVPEPIPEISVSETKPELIPQNPVSETKPEPIPENAVSETKPEPIPENPVSETEPKQASKQIGSRKASNPAFIAAQSKFEELTSSLTNPLKSPGSSKQDDEPGSGSGSPKDIGSSDPLKPANISIKDDVAGCGSVEPRDDLVNHGSRVVQTGGSECGTELSITSTLDSPDPFEFENTKFEEADTSINYDNNNNNNSNSSSSDNNNNNIGVVTPEKQVDQKPNNIEPEPESSHITNLESQGTPSSQISTTSKKTRTDKKVLGQTRKSWSTSKKSSPVSSSVDSGLRTSLEHLPKESKPGKRRNVFGSPKRDHVDGELVVPGYMQATESARAKAVANISPRSSPDFKKRHSLPGPGNDRHGSPRIQRSPSQALPTTKGNGNQERKWQI
ncbi:protein IQ-DOMAIN 32-like [Bidens hawaiensis]|uniref:protein IQ-DOMAIN 32-like n=1 Tax=Bidens hawaiensis TaxID=980011 RepID=UPI00404B7D90